MTWLIVMEEVTSKVLQSPPWLGYLLRNICLTNDDRCIPFVLITIPSFSQSWLFTRFVRVTQRVLLEKQVLLTLPQHPSIKLWLSSLPHNLITCVEWLTSKFCNCDREVYLITCPSGETSICGWCFSELVLLKKKKEDIIDNHLIFVCTYLYIQTKTVLPYHIC